MWEFRQTDGSMTRDGVFAEFGYSGHGDGLNNPSMQDVPNVGPIPEGSWTIGAALFDPEHGPVVMALIPKDGTITFGRSGFLIHGDEIGAPGQHLASHGCIILSHATRSLIAQSNDTDLEVVQ